MTTLIVKNMHIKDLLLAQDATLNDANKPLKLQKLQDCYSKIVISPVFHTLKIWVGDKIEIQPPYVINEMPNQEEDSDIPSTQMTEAQTK